MAFNCTVQGSDFSGSIFRKGLGHAALYPIGHDDTEDRSYALLTTLDPVAGYDDDVLELSFCVIEYDGETDSEHPFWSGKDTATIIIGEDRRAVLAMLAMAATHLLKSANPARVFMCTRDSDAPEKANWKFIVLGHVFEACGYSVNKPDSYLGQTCWWMERR